MRKLIRTADVRNALDSYDRGEISYTKMVELLNDSAIRNLKQPTILWLDDVRNPFLDFELKVPVVAGDIVWVRSFEEFNAWITNNGTPDVISFDHDLGDVNDAHPEKTGMDCAKSLIDYCIDNDAKLPRIYVHSSNPVGSENIRCLLNNFLKNIQ